MSLLGNEVLELEEANERLAKALRDIRDFIARYDKDNGNDGLYYEGWEHSDSEYIVGLVDAAIAPVPR